MYMYTCTCIHVHCMYGDHDSWLSFPVLVDYMTCTSTSTFNTITWKVQILQITQMGKVPALLHGCVHVCVSDTYNFLSGLRSGVFFSFFLQVQAKRGEGEGEGRGRGREGGRERGRICRRGREGGRGREREGGGGGREGGQSNR